MNDGTSAKVRSHGKNLPGGQRSQLVQSLLDALTNVPVGHGKYLTYCCVTVSFANPDCCSDRRKIAAKESVWNSSRKGISRISPSLFPTPLN